MSKIKTKKNNKSVASYLNNIVDPKRRKECKEIAKMMQGLTGDKPAMWGDSLVGFGWVKYKYSTGKEAPWMKMGFASRKDAISLYLMCDLDQVADLFESLGKYKRGVGCLYVKTLEDVDVKVLKKLMVTSLKLLKTNPKVVK